jgi:hypothetical protein
MSYNNKHWATAKYQSKEPSNFTYQEPGIIMKVLGSALTIFVIANVLVIPFNVIVVPTFEIISHTHKLITSQSN